MIKGPIFVTGTDSQWGPSIARALARIGCDLTLHAGEPARLSALARELSGRVRVYVVGAPPEAAGPPLARAFQEGAAALGPMQAAVCADLARATDYPEWAATAPLPATAWGDAFAAVRGGPNLLMSAQSGLSNGGRVVVLRGVPAPGNDRPLLRAALHAADVHRVAATRELFTTGITVITIDVPLSDLPAPEAVAERVVAALQPVRAPMLGSLREEWQAAGARFEKALFRGEIDLQTAQHEHAARQRELFAAALGLISRSLLDAGWTQLTIKAPRSGQEAVILFAGSSVVCAPQNVGTSIKSTPISLDEAIERLGPDPIETLHEAMHTVPAPPASSPPPMPRQHPGGWTCDRCNPGKRRFGSEKALANHTRDLHIGRTRKYVVPRPPPSETNRPVLPLSPSVMNRPVPPPPSAPAPTKEQGRRADLVRALAEGKAQRQELASLLFDLVTWAQAETADGELVEKVITAYQHTLTKDDQAYFVAMAVVYHLRVESALIDQHFPELRKNDSWAWRFFGADEARWLDTVRRGETPPHNGANGSRLLYPRALELAIRTSSGVYNPFIDRLFELHGSPDESRSRLDQALAGLRDEAAVGLRSSGAASEDPI